jgi:hypothetical protein
MASPDAGLRMVYFGWATPEEFKVDIAQVLEEDPDLRNFSPEQLRRLFAIWLNKGDTQRIESLMATRPEWLKAGYRALAEADAARGDYIKAVDLMKRYLPAPQFPRVSLPHEEAARRFTEDPGDVAAGITVYNEAMAAGRDVEALATLRAMATNADCPGYVHYLEGQLLDQCPDAGGR